MMNSKFSKLILGLTLALPFLPAICNAGDWVSRGHWEFQESVDYNKFPDSRWKQTVVFDIYDTSPESRTTVQRELAEIGNMVNGKGLVKNYNRMTSLSEKWVNSYINSFGQIPGRFKEKTARRDLLGMNIMLFSHKLNGQSSADLYKLYDNLQSLRHHTLYRKWFTCTIGNGDKERSVKCEDVVIPFISKAKLARVTNQFSKLYGFNPNKSSFVMYNKTTNELLVARYKQQNPDDLVKLYPINLNTGKGGAPLFLSEFRF
ncbi:hypothetical protein BCT01_00675 [Vibrio tasmaniensis]|nr:hypothetical protein BCT01_00675 [Vibrio tasmaniensis]PMP09998.1 hypothetical protein BCS92_02415 [Vibrio tasmaniensis]